MWWNKAQLPPPPAQIPTWDDGLQLQLTATGREMLTKKKRERNSTPDLWLVKQRLPGFSLILCHAGSHRLDFVVCPGMGWKLMVLAAFAGHLCVQVLFWAMEALGCMDMVKCVFRPYACPGEVGVFQASFWLVTGIGNMRLKGMRGVWPQGHWHRRQQALNSFNFLNRTWMRTSLESRGIY